MSTRDNKEDRAMRKEVKINTQEDNKNPSKIHLDNISEDNEK